MIRKALLNKDSSVFSLTWIFATFLLLLTVFPGWIYSPLGWVDSWGYFGEALDPVGLRRALPAHPAGELIPLIWPAATIHALLPTVAANFVYKALTFCLAGLLFFRLMRQYCEHEAAALTTLLFLLYKFTILAIGSDYTDGRVVLYVVCTLFFLSRASEPKSSATARQAYLLAGGFFYSCSVFTAFLSIVFGLAYLTITFAHRRVRWADGVFIPAAGFLLGIAIFSTIHWSYTGDFFFFRYTVEKVTVFLGVTRGMQEFNLFRLSWVQLALLASGVSPFYFVYNRLRTKSWPPRDEIIFWLMHVLAFLPMLYLQYFRHQETVSTYHYFNQMLPLTFASLGVIFVNPLFRSAQFRRYFWPIMGTAFLSALLSFCHVTEFFGAVHPNLGRLLFSIFLTLAAGALILRQTSAALLIGLLSIYLYSYNKNEANHYLTKERGLGPESRSFAETLANGYNWVQLIRQINPGRDKFLWYSNQGRRLYFSGFAAASHLWQGRILNEQFPRLEVEMGECGIFPITDFVGHELVIVYKDIQEMIAARSNFWARGLDFLCRKPHPFPVSKDTTLSVNVCEVTRPNDQHPAQRKNLAYRSCIGGAPVPPLADK